MDEADYHIHFGHGGKDPVTEEQEICLYEWNWGNEDHNGLKGDVVWDMVNSYYVATTSAFGGDVKAAAITDTEDQFYHDHLWDQGEVKQDESLNDNIVWYAEWSC